MPLSKYFSGAGEKVMRAMKKTYGSEKGGNVFYATANKQKNKKNGIGPSIELAKRFISGKFGEKKERNRLKPPRGITGIRG